ncbi:MAG: AzlD domain-containing protein [Cyanothece sp. SIO1E1]|nr:AzlD domain-containing protein [Cyanothece sp. SIO1E1]
MMEIYLIGGMALATFFTRYIIFALSGRITLSKPMRRALHYVPPVLLIAIVVPEVLIPGGRGEIELSYMNARLVGAIATLIVGWRSQNLLFTILSGMLTCFGWQWFLSIV